MNVNLHDLVKNIHLEVIHWRRELHSRPELSYNEINTANYVAALLKSFGGYEITRPTQNSVVARLIGSSSGKILALRADMDALPLQELGNCEYISKNDGIMHACGHDGHTASLLGVAKILSQYKDKIDGEVRLIFQHAEEVPPGGAQELINLGALDNVDMIVGIHLWSTMPLGKIGLIAGPMMAAPDIFDIKIIGKGGHGGFPHQTIDSIVIGSQVVTNLQQIISRQINPLDNAVISITKFIGGSAYNVIPDSVSISGTVRSFDNSVRHEVVKSMERVINGITSAHGATYSFDYTYGYDPVCNDESVVNFLEEVIINSFDDTWIDKMKPNMAGEDFSAYLAKVPGCFMFVGAGNVDKGIIYPHHHPKFNIDEDALAVSVKIFVATVFKYFSLPLDFIE